MAVMSLSAVLDSDHSITLKALPFKPGTSVNVTVSPRIGERPIPRRGELWLQPLVYTEPFEPV